MLKFAEISAAFQVTGGIEWDSMEALIEAQ